MNERIKQLALQAGGEFWQRIESDGVLNKEAYITFDSPESLEKFVMLVIQDYKNDLREDRKSIKRELGYSRIGRNNV
jgi:hypothetical protein